VSDEGRRVLPTTSPVFSETSTMSADVIVPYGMPLGLMTIRPATRSTADRLPNVPITSPLAARSMFAR
jgi:hypothetical protein